MKRFISVLLALTLLSACLVSLGGCGSEISGKEGFLESESYFSAFAGMMLSPVMSADYPTDEVELVPRKSSTTLTLTDLSIFETLFGTPVPSPVKLSIDSTMIPSASKLLATVAAEVAGDGISAEITAADGLIGIASELIGRGIGLTYEDLMLMLQGGIEAEEAAGDIQLPDALAQGVMPDFKIPNISPDTLKTLIEKYWDIFTDSIDDSCFANGEDTFRTADGDKKLDTVTLTLDSAALMESVVAVITELKSDAEVAQILRATAEANGESGDEYISDFNDSLDEMLASADTAEATDDSIAITRFIKDGKLCGDRVTLAVEGETYIITLGCTEGKNGGLAFLTVADGEGTEYLSVDCESADNTATLTAIIRSDASEEDATGETPELTETKIVISGVTEDVGGAKQTTATYKLGIGGMMMQLFETVTTVRSLTAEKTDISITLNVSLSTLLFGGDGSVATMSMTLDCLSEAAPDAVINAPDMTDTYSYAELISNADEIAAAVGMKIQTQHPQIAAFIAAISGLMAGLEAQTAV